MERVNRYFVEHERSVTNVWELVAVGIVVALATVALAWVYGFTGEIDQMALSGLAGR